MPDSLFVSDLHLAPERPATVELFVSFLGGRAREAERLFILGDLFDAWIGDDDDTPPYPAVRTGLRELTASGTRCYLMHGNRDFLLGRGFTRDTGCTLLSDPTRLDIEGSPTLLMHGDLLCTDDLPYQRFRRRIRNPIVIRLFLWKSLEKRRAIAADYRLRSGAATSQKAEEIMDVSQTTVAHFMRRHGARRLIHGHTHRPRDHHFELDGVPVTRSVLAEWHEDRGEVLVGSAGGWRRDAVTRG
ncbi:MAG: UDP-2,3-diacylglucosamine diphosphatase [Chromatiaceae bacterium]